MGVEDKKEGSPEMKMTRERAALRDPERDWLLELFVDYANRRDFEMAVSLQVGGSFVTGFLIGYDKYMEGIMEQFRHAVGEPSAADQQDKPPLPRRKPRFVHLRDVRIWGVPNVTAVHAPFWRGRLSQIDAFILGAPDEIGPESEPLYAG